VILFLDFEKEEIKKFFGPCINRNGYQYVWSINNAEHIVEVKNCGQPHIKQLN
jgi:hypothetical protein